jgi:hypothetical protein
MSDFHHSTLPFPIWTSLADHGQRGPISVFQFASNGNYLGIPTTPLESIILAITHGGREPSMR